MTFSTIKLLFLACFLAWTLQIQSQASYTLDFTIRDLPGKKLWLACYYGDQKIRIDTSVTDPHGHVVFSLSEDDEPGMYRLELEKDRGLDFLFNKEDVALVLGSEFRLEGLTVVKSRENEIFFDYYRHKFDLEDRLEILGSFLRYYPPTDTFYFTVGRHAERLAGVYEGYLDSIQANFGNLLAARIIRFDQLPDIRPGELTEAARDLYRAHYFSGVNLYDTLILNTPLLPVKIIDYLSLYVQPGGSREQQEVLFIRAVDSLMKFTDGSPQIREMMVNYLINGFQAYGFETVLTHLVENYVLGQSCVSDQQEAKLKVRIEGFKKLAVGTRAPDFEIAGSKGETVSLSSFKGKQLLLIFWSADCPHCRAILPELNNLYAQFRNKAEFVAVSVDENEEQWRKALEEEKLQFINVAELKGWDGQMVLDYYVYATPTFLLIDPAGMIAAKPTGVGEIMDILGR